MVGIRVFLPFIGIKLKLFRDEGTLRVHFEVHLGYIAEKIGNELNYFG